MSDPPETFIISPQGRSQFWCGVLFLGVPVLLLLGWFLVLDPGAREWHVTGMMQRLVLVVLLCAMLAGSVAAGLYCTVCRRFVTIAPAENTVIQTTRFLGRTLRLQRWNLSDFESIEVRHHEYSDVPEHSRLTIVGIKHASDLVLWLRGFWSPPTGISKDALAFAAALRESAGLRFDLSSVAVTRIGNERMRNQFPR
jgi:hypothetical protein